jgi:hypothetical protein
MVPLFGVIDELADWDAHRAGDSEHARDAGVVARALDAGDRLVV